MFSFFTYGLAAN